MDIFARLDRIEDFVANSKRVPLSSSVMLNEAEFYDYLDDIRATLPNELKKARLVSKERDRILGEARHKEEELLVRAEERADRMVQDTEIIKQAELERDHMIDEAQEEARKIIYDAEDVADRIFGELEASLIEVRESTEEILSRITTWREKLRGYPEEPLEESEYEYEGGEE
jgi:vacuolar-type H+-ATPase subunit H